MLVCRENSMVLKAKIVKAKIVANPSVHVLLYTCLLFLCCVCSMLQEFLFFLLPLINFRKIKNFLVRNLLRKSKSETGVSRQHSDGVYKECVVCAEWPTHPHGIVNCPHVFCYFCLQVLGTTFCILSH